MSIDYRACDTPISVKDVEDMSQYIHEAYSVAMLLSQLDETQDIDPYALTEIGNCLIRLLSQPMEAAGGIMNEKKK